MLQRERSDNLLRLFDISMEGRLEGDGVRLASLLIRTSLEQGVA